MIAEVQVISNHGWDITYLFIGAVIGMFGAVLMMIWQEVRDKREANENGGRGDSRGEDGQ